MTRQSAVGRRAPESAAPSAFVARLLPAPDEAPAAADDLQGVLAWDDPADAVPPSPPVAVRVLPPEPGAWASRFAQAAAEVVGGHRNAAQLVGWTTPPVLRDIERRARLAARASAGAARPRQHGALRPQVGSVHVCRLGPEVAEVSVRVRQGRRSRALALRLEAREGRWRCTAVEFG